jgi:hypothetical protein
LKGVAGMDAPEFAVSRSVVPEPGGEGAIATALIAKF